MGWANVKERLNVDEKTMYLIGIRDGYAKMFMEMRISGINETLLDIAEKLAAQDNPHAKWYLDQYRKQDVSNA